jgi:predicted permease
MGDDEPRRDGRRWRGYRRLLRMLPAGLRHRFGSEMEELLRVRLAEAGSAPARGLVWLRAIGDVCVQAIASVIEDREQGGWQMRTLAQDIRYGIRAAVATPGLALVVVLTLALVIGASTATFSVVHTVLLEEYPFEEPDRLVFVWPEHNANKAMTLLAAERMPSLETVSGLSGWALTLTGEGEPRELDGLLVSPGYFEMLGVRPALGRTFSPDEDLPGRAGVVILSHALWVDAFGADPEVVDRVIDLGGADYERRRVIGVMPPEVDDFWRDSDVWVPLEGDPALGLAEDDTWYVNDRLARLRPGATLAQANAEVRQYAAYVQRALPGQVSAEEAAAATVRSVRAHLTRDVGTAIWTALGAVGLVLLIGCFNVANLLLARGDSRARDLAVRAALGAGRTRMTRMLLAEAASLGVAGGALGVCLAVGLVRIVVGLAPETFPNIDAVSVTPSVLIFALVITLLSTIVAGLVPALRVGRVDATTSLAGGARGAVAHTGGRLTTTLVGGQVALAVVVTVGSGLMLRSLTTLLAVDPGLDGEGVLALKPNPPTGRYPDGLAFQAYYAQVTERVAAVPGIESVGAIHLLPGGTGNWSFPVYPEGSAAAPAAPVPNVNFRAISGDYFRTLRIPLVAGRTPHDTDGADAEPVVAVNQAFVDRFWPGEQAVGKTLSIFSAAGSRHRVVGVVADVRQHARDTPPLAEMYFTHAQVPWDQMWMWVVARVQSGDPMDAARAVQEAIWSIDPDVPISGVADMADVLGQSTRTTRFMATLLSGFGALALGLSAVGVFGVASYTSGRRRPEFGVRLALGSSRSEVVRGAIVRSLGPVMVGLVAGLAVAAATSRLLTSALFGVRPLDPITFAAVTVLLGVVGVLASAIPAWRASRVDPVSVLSSD